MIIGEKRYVAGIDVGSTAIKVTLYDGFRHENWLEPSGWNPRQGATALLSRATQAWGIDIASLSRIFGTGYGRVGLAFLSKAITEITCHGRGAASLSPGVRTVIDIGGQDAKAISVDASGKVLDFVMNDKCAAGTGRFLQVMATALDLDIADMTAMVSESAEAHPINSMCAVFAESEIIGLLNKGVSRSAIILGLYKSIASRTAAMAYRINLQPPFVLTGGVSRHSLLRAALEQELKAAIIVPAAAIYAGSLGAALYAWDDLIKGGNE